MKRRALALLLIFALALAPAALASDALGWDLIQEDTVLGPGVTMTTQTFWGDSIQDYRRERFVTYTPGQGSTPLVYYSATVRTTATLTNMAKAIESWTGRVLAGANGDYFVMSSGVPLGLVVTDGVLRSSASYHYAVGFLPDGSAFVGKPDLSITADFSGYHLAVGGGYNKARETGAGYTLFSPDFGDATRGTGAGVNVILRPVAVPEDYEAPEKPAPFLDPEPPRPEAAEGAAESAEPAEPSQWDIWNWTRQAWEAEMDQWRWDLAWSVEGFETLPAQLSIGGELTCVVESVSEADGATPIPAGRLVLSVAKGADSFLVEALSGLAVGEQVKLAVSAPDPRWSQAVSALGAYEWILRDGQVPAGLDATAAPRTALGIKPDGDVILYTIDGRQTGYSRGAGVTQVAKRLVELGCDQAVLFDGGGSTTFGATGALDSAFSLQNKPSDGAQRAVTDALFFISSAQPTGVLGSLYIQPHSGFLLSGAKLALSARGIDTGYYPMGEEPVSGVTYAAQGPGTISGNVLTAGAEKGVVTLTATAPGGATGESVVNVVATPDVITVSDAATGQQVSGVNLDPGQSLALSASAAWHKLPLLADNSCFTWIVDPEVGTVDPAGVLTAGELAAAGKLYVTAGELTATIPVTVGGRVATLDDFEGETPVPESDDAAVRHTADQVKLGRQSLEIAYPLDQSATLTWSQPLGEGARYLGLWYLSDGPVPALELQLTTADGESQRVAIPLQPGEDWQHVLLPLPEGAAAIEALTLTPGGEMEEEGTGRLYLDHLTAANGPVTDTTPPTAQLTWDGAAVTATLSDNTDKTFPPENLKLTLDGWDLGFTLAGNVLTAPFSRFDANAHRVSLELRDASGNLARVSLDVPAQGEAAPPFTDIDGHWARENIIYLAQQGVTNGRQSGDGTFVFDPQTNITRGEFAAMLARWLRVDLTAYEGADLPFVDSADIPAWARGAVAYLADTGVMTGSLESGGLYANAGDPITRAQAMAMLGRVQAKGYLPQSQPFSDDGDIPAWARGHIYTLAGQKVVSGYEGFVRPQDPITRGEVAKLLTTLW